MRLSDVLTTGTLTDEPDAPRILSPEAVQRLLEDVRSEASEGRLDEALATLDAMVSRLDPKGAGGRAVELERARILEGAGRLDDALACASGMLADSPPPGIAVEARLVRARIRSARGEWTAVAGDFDAILQADPPAIGGEAVRSLAMEAFVRAGLPDRSRSIPAASTPPTPEQAGTSVFWLVEGLLLADDPFIPVPDAPSGGTPLADRANLRRGLLHELRGELSEAAAIYADLSGRATSLEDWESALLAERREGSGAAP